MVGATEGISDSRLRGWMMLALVAMVFLVTLVIIMILFKSWRRNFKRQQQESRHASGKKVDPWVESGKRMHTDQELD